MLTELYFSILDKSQIYSEICSYFGEYSKSYIVSILDNLYKENIIVKDVYQSTWLIFTRSFVINKIEGIIQSDTEKSKHRLVLAKVLLLQEDCSYDIIWNISQML